MSSVGPGDVLELRVEDLAFGGRGLARLDGLVVFVDGAIPGQKVRAIVRKRRRQYAEATALEVLERSPHEIEPLCPHFGSCGGCTLQNLAYEKQLEYKAKQVRDLVERIGRLASPPLEPVLPSPSPFFYRNKMEFSFSDRPFPTPPQPGALLALGLHRRGSFDEVVDLRTCFLHAPETADVLAIVRDFARASGLPAYSNRRHEGFWRFLVLRRGVRTGQWMVNIVTTELRKELLEQLVVPLRERLPGLRSVVNNVNTGKGGVAFGEREEVVWGETSIEEKLGSLVFAVSANSFFQTNTEQAERLYTKVLELADLSGGETVYDLYCGTGAISIFLAPHAKAVLGVELVESAVEDAWKNCERNSVGNCQFVASDVVRLFRDPQELLQRYGRPDVLVLDPPREGVHPRVLKRLPALGARRIVYVSCNPATQARDLSALAGTYRVERICPVDMFPHTAHIETVALLVAR
ncbi:MAG: 23S rRNA (uracil(1939)-C(5))-methyltransferase RlmD [candidate division KSB1 bacterium]|nr:23S rRNA (uracil(1939)-C(5))-methyltransferase RlmD [candidate division KSB1 bacterium]